MSYLLDTFQVLRGIDYETRVKIRFAFDTFSQQLMTPANFLTLIRRFGCFAEQAARVLVDACTDPASIVEISPPRSWTVYETALLLAGATLSRGNKLMEYLPRRQGENCWNKRVKRVISGLSEHKMLTHDGILRKWAIIHCDEVTIRPQDSRKMNKVASNKFMSLSSELAKLKTSVYAQQARHGKKVQALSLKIDSLQTKKEEEPDRLQTLLMQWADLARTDPNGRRYSALVYDISELIRATSRKAYRILRQVVPAPSESSLFRNYGERISRYRMELTQEDLLEKRIRDVIERSGKGTLATIGIDAFSFRTFGQEIFHEGQCVEEYSNAFLFTHIALDSSLPVQVIHIHKKENGAYDDTVESLFLRIKEIFAGNESPLWFKATDGDRYLSREHEEFFAEHIEEHRNDYGYLVQSLYDKICAGMTMPLSDPLHFAKNMRGKIIDHEVALVDDDTLILLVNAGALEKALKLGDALTDRSQLGRMRDVYVTKLFTLQNVCKLIEHKDYAGALALLPYAAIFTVLYSTNISVQTRVFFTKLAYICFDRLLTESTKIVANNCCIKHRFSCGCLAISMAEPGYIKRMMHTCLGLGISLLFGPRTLRLAAIGTHTVENAIGIARSISNSTKYDSICSAFATAELRKELAKKHDITLHIPKRVNDGGAKIDTLSEDGIENPTTWDPYDIVSTFVECCNAELRPASLPDMLKFGRELSCFLLDLEITKLSDTSEVANALIVQRNYKFKSCSTTDAGAPE